MININKYVIFCSLIQFSDDFGVKQETNMVKLLEKQYQERLEEEVAKVSLYFGRLLWFIFPSGL